MLIINPVRRFLEVDGVIYEILDNTVHKMKKGFCYIKDNYIYIYGGKIKNKNDLTPGYCYKYNDNIIYINHNEKDKEKYSIDKIMCISNNKIIEKINKDDNFKEVDRTIIDNSDEYFAPEILSTDNILKVIVKKILKKKKINLKSIRDKFKNDYDISNMKGALLKAGPMSMMYFQKWIELLECKITITYEFEDYFGDKIKEKEII